MIAVSKILHKNAKRIKLDFPYNQEVAAIVKQIPDARWSKTLSAWHVPYNKESIRCIKQFFPAIDIESELGIKPKEVKLVEKTEVSLEDATNKKETNKLVNDKTNIQQQSKHSTNEKDVDIDVIGRHIYIKIPKNVHDTQYILSFRYARWDNKEYRWVIPYYKSNLELLCDYFKLRIRQFHVHESIDLSIKSGETRKLNKNEVLIIQTKSKRLKVIYGYNQALTDVIKDMPYHRWDAKNKYWSVPLSDILLQRIRTCIEEQGLTYKFEVEEDIGQAVARITPADIPNYRTCPDEMILKLKELRYSENTICTYTNAFSEFINYFHRYNIDDINEQMIVEYLRYLVIDRRVSSSYQNQSINAIKFYYERVLGGARKFYFIDRPLQEKTLPVVLSEAEVSEMIKAIDNIKHKCIVMMLYSAGLRMSELLNLKLSDIDSDRMQVRVEQSKGKKDRYTILSRKMLVMLRKYYKTYKPREYLFEGMGGGQYAATSVQSIVKDAAIKAGIKKRVTTHTLRHSFATHLLEQGVNLRYIQSILGHANSKTTEVYTHITTKGMDQLVSPLDKINF